MSSIQSSASNELQYIYAVLRKLKHIRRAGLKLSPRSSAIGLENLLFPRKFLLRLIDERLSFLNELAVELASELFKQLSKDVRGAKFGPLKQTRSQSVPKCLELEEYFHYSFYYVYDFMIELDWYEADLDYLSRSDSDYVRSKLSYVNRFFAFRKTLTNLDAHTIWEVKDDSVNITNSSEKKISSSPGLVTKFAKSIKSSLAGKSKLDSPTRRRRVRFSDSIKDVYEDVWASNRYASYEQSIVALDLLIYALNLFVQQMYNQLVNWSKSSTSTLENSLTLLKESRRKLRASQLFSISTQIKASNDVHLTILGYLYEIKNVYLKDYILNIICARDAERPLKLYKSPRVSVFAKKISFDMERKIISSLANQCLQLLLDLITSEINLPPVELESDTKTKTKQEVARSRENYLNFITSWLNVDGGLFDFTGAKRPKNAAVTVTKERPPITSAKTSTLSLGVGKFKSSDRILAQMDNLNELMRNILNHISDRIQSPQQLKYFLGLVYTGMNQLFDIIERQLTLQLSTIKGKKPRHVSSDDPESISKGVDLIAVRIRCLKLIQILSSIDNQIKDIVNSNESSLETKLIQFARIVDE